MLVVLHLPLEALQYQYPEAYGRWLARCSAWGFPSPLPPYGHIWIEDGIIREMYECKDNDCEYAKRRRGKRSRSR